MVNLLTTSGVEVSLLILSSATLCQLTCVMVIYVCTCCSAHRHVVCHGVACAPVYAASVLRIMQVVVGRPAPQLHARWMYTNRLCTSNTWLP